MIQIKYRVHLLVGKPFDSCFKVILRPYSRDDSEEQEDIDDK